MQSNNSQRSLRLLLVGGTFNHEGGRSSGYVAKLGDALALQLPSAQVSVINGGLYADLAAHLDKVQGVTHLAWFADVPNELPKLLPALKRRYPALVLIASKNNRKGLYDRAALYGRMQAARSELLVEFANGVDGKLVASVLTAQATVALESSSDIEQVAQCLAEQFHRLGALVLPLAKTAFPTRDADSFKERDFSRDTEIPLAEHPGAFGVVRKNHIHEGVDLYGQPGDVVLAMEGGVVVARQPFTGIAADSPWWGDTECILVEGASGVLNYGELTARADLSVGSVVCAGELLGHLATVLLKDKGRPQTMLHLERYVTGTRQPLKEWSLGQDQPVGLRDPSALILQAANAKEPT